MKDELSATLDAAESGEAEARPKPEWVLVIEREHAMLQALLRTLEARLSLSEPVQTWSVAVGETLSTLVPALRQHFEREERELSPARVESSFPSLAGRIADLNLEHDELLTAFERARQDCDERNTDPDLIGEVRRDLLSAASDLRQHERVEAELLTVARWFDLPDHR